MQTESFPNNYQPNNGSRANTSQPVNNVGIAAAAVNLTKIYGSGERAVTAINQVSVHFQQGSFTAIMGPSGSGKSTLMHCLAGLDKLTSGEAILGGVALSKLNDKQITRLRREKVGFIFQSFNLLPSLTAAQNILLPLDLMGKKPDKQLFNLLVETLKIKNRLTHRPSELSGGQQQRVAIARAMITNPQVIFADEPTGALDSKSGIELLEYLRSCSRDFNRTIIMVTHDPKAASYADRALVLFDGLIVNDLAQPNPTNILSTLGNLGA